MSGPDINLEERNPLGGLDRLVTGVGLAILAVFPTLLAVTFMPWKLGSLIVDDEPDGRKGMLLSPGAYFILFLGVVLVFVGSTVTPEMIENGDNMIGDRLATDVITAAKGGNIWGTISQTTPIFVLTLGFGVIARLLRRWAGPRWDLRASLRTNFYAIATVVGWIILVSFALSLHQDPQVASDGPSGVIPLIGFILLLWIYFWCFRSVGGLSILRSVLLTLSLAMLILISTAMLGVIVSQF